MLYKENQDLTELAESIRPQDTRQSIDFSATQSRFVKYLSGFWYSRKLETNFMRQNISIDFSVKGTRPTFTKIVEVTTPGKYYLIKFTNKLLALCTEIIPPVTDLLETDTRILKVIGTKEQDLKFVFVELQGAGGGGVGGSHLRWGDGGASGGYLMVCINVEAMPREFTMLEVGVGGKPTLNYGQAESGRGSGFWYSATDCCFASGGGGGYRDTVVTTRTNEISGVDSFIYVVKDLQGGKTSFDSPKETFTYGTDNGSIEVGGFISIDNNAYAGGSSYLAVGGAGGVDQYNGSDGSLGSAGGGGSYKIASQTWGGTGGNGYVAIYY